MATKTRKKVGKGGLRLGGTPLELRRRARLYLSEAADALQKARALHEQADKVEAAEDDARDAFLRREHLKTCEECRAGGLTPDDREVAFHIAHLGRGSGVLAGDDLKRRGL